jgi:thiamine-phosphate pyrophosphorylase
MATELKSFRHALRQMWANKGQQLLQSRNVTTDEGQYVEAKDEYRRESEDHIIKANVSRAQEAMRVLEEFSKMESTSQAKDCEKMRYRLYELEKTLMSERPSYPKKALYILITKSLCLGAPLDILEQVCLGGADVVQLREKEMEDGEFLKWIREAKEVTDRHGIPLIVNDRIHLAILSDAAGVHMGQGDLSTKDARSLLKPSQWLGRSTHGMEEASQAEEEGADYIGVGPLFLTNTKRHRVSVGVKYLRDVEANLDIPYVGIGAVNREHWDEILAAKPRGLAICTAIIGHENPEDETRYYKTSLEASWGRHESGPRESSI